MEQKASYEPDMTVTKPQHAYFVSSKSRSRSFLLMHVSQMPAKSQSLRYLGESPLVSPTSSQSVPPTLICCRQKPVLGPVEMAPSPLPAKRQWAIVNIRQLGIYLPQQKHYLPVLPRLQTPTLQGTVIPSKFPIALKTHVKQTNLGKICLYTILLLTNAYYGWYCAGHQSYNSVERHTQ